MNPRLALPATKSEEALGNETYAGGGLPAGPVATSEPESVLAADLLLGLWRERRFIAKACAMGFLVAAVVSLLIPPQYQATTRLMPPERSKVGGLGGLLAAASDDKAGSVVGSLVSDAVGVRTSAALYLGILRSQTVEDAMIKRFDLLKVYRTSQWGNARAALAEATEASEDRKSGIISISVTDRSAKRATEMTRAYPEILNDLTSQLNTSSAHRERVFLEDRLKTAKQDLDAAEKDLSEFSSKNQTMDVKEQAREMLGGAAALQGELIATQSQLSGLEQIYSSNNVRVRSLQARIAELKQQLSQLKGVNPSTGASDPNAPSEFGVSLSKLPFLGVSYGDLYRRVRIQEVVYETLTKEYELAKIDEVRELPTVKVLDEAALPEGKVSPKRTVMSLTGALLGAFLALVWLVASRQWLVLSATRPSFGLVSLEVREGFASDVQFLRDRGARMMRRLVPARTGEPDSRSPHSGDQ